MNDELIKQLAEKFGTTTEYLWSVLVMQARINAYECTFYSLFILTSWYVLYKFCKKNYSEDSLHRDDIFLECLFPTGSVMYILVTVIALPFIMSDILTCIFNPEYWALSQILHICK